MKIIFFGGQQAGKTTLIKNLFHPTFPKNFKPAPTPGFVSENVLFQNIFMEVWELSGEQYLALRELQYETADIAIYCVDLSSTIDKNLIAKEIQNFRELNKEASLILVGTKADRVNLPELRLGSIDLDNFNAYFSLPSDDNLSNFLKNLNDIARPILSKKIKKISQNELKNLSVNLYEQAKKYLPLSSPIYEAIDGFMEAAHQLPKEKYLALGREVFLLIDACRHENKNKIPNHLEIFMANCNSLLDSKNPYLKNTILVLGAAVFITFIVAALGFVFGLAAGLWGGPLAFLTAIATSYAAISILAISGGCGLGAGLLTAYGLFTEKTTITGFLNDIAEVITLNPQVCI